MFAGKNNICVVCLSFTNKPVAYECDHSLCPRCCSGTDNPSDLESCTLCAKESEDDVDYIPMKLLSTNEPVKQKVDLKTDNKTEITNYYYVIKKLGMFKRMIIHLENDLKWRRGALISAETVAMHRELNAGSLTEEERKFTKNLHTPFTSLFSNPLNGVVCSYLSEMKGASKLDISSLMKSMSIRQEIVKVVNMTDGSFYVPTIERLEDARLNFQSSTKWTVTNSTETLVAASMLKISPCRELFIDLTSLEFHKLFFLVIFGKLEENTSIRLQDFQTDDSERKTFALLSIMKHYPRYHIETMEGHLSQKELPVLPKVNCFIGRITDSENLASLALANDCTAIQNIDLHINSRVKFDGKEKIPLLNKLHGIKFLNFSQDDIPKLKDFLSNLNYSTSNRALIFYFQMKTVERKRLVDFGRILIDFKKDFKVVMAISDDWTISLRQFWKQTLALTNYCQSVRFVSEKLSVTAL